VLRFLISCLFLVALSNAAAAGSRFQTDTARTCTGAYALCTSAPCVPDPREPNKKAICECETAEGMNYGTSTCEDREPGRHDNELTLLSQYSFVQAPTHPVVSCSGGSPWTDCLDMPCTIDPANPLRAICTCDIVTDGSDFVTYGGSCNTNSCIRSLWSAASPQDFLNGSKQLIADMNLTDEPVPYSYCPGQDIDKDGNWLADPE